MVHRIYAVVLGIAAIWSAEYSFANNSSESHSSSHESFYSSICGIFGIPARFTPVAASVCVALLLLLAGLRFRQQVLSQLHKGNLTPTNKVSLVSICELILSFLYELAESQFGKSSSRHLPLLASLFAFILISNLTGLVPGLTPPTSYFMVNLSMGLAVFLSYHGSGIREHGLGYVKQFTGPFLILAPLFVVLELVSHCTRPLSLAFRLTANIFCDHLVLGVFTGLVPFGVPALLLVFGLMVACIQSFVFTILSSIYIQMAVSHDH